MNSNNIFISPKTGEVLKCNSTLDELGREDEVYYKKDDVWVFLEHLNNDYEGAYLNKVKYIPRRDVFPFVMPLWMMVSGYLWEVRKQFSGGARICELGCASGVNYFGQRYDMIGIDYSMESLRAIENYSLKIQADAIRLPFQDGSLDGIISSYFWEHILPADKEIMLKEFFRVLKPRGKVVMLYDVETQNRLIGYLKLNDPGKYESLFLHGDYHIGYETMEDNKAKFAAASFRILKHFGMERTFVQSNSVYVKLSTCPGWYGQFAKVMRALTSSGSKAYVHMLLVRIVDVSIGRLWHPRKSRIAISVLQKGI